MSETSKPSNNVGDEIDLKTVLNRIGAFFKSIFNLIAYAIRLTFKKWLFLIPFLVVGLGLGYLAHEVTKPFYQSSMVMMLSNIRNDFVKNYLYNLSELVAENNFNEISKKLNIDIEEAKQIKELTFVNLDEDKIEEDSILTASPFRIDLKLYDNQLFPKMESSLTTYLENNPFFSRNKIIRQQQIESLLAKLKQDISSIDSVKTLIVKPDGPVNGFVYGEATDPTNLYKESLSMFERRTILEADLKKLDNIQVVVGFTNRSKPASMSLKKFMFYGALSAYLLGLIILLARSNREEIFMHQSDRY